jgi:cysteinyl-tRNA synthetase
MLRMLGLENLLEADEKPDDEALKLLEERESARQAKDFATADARRDDLAARGWIVRDTAEGPQLVRQR